MDGANADVNMAQVRDLQASLFPICTKGTIIIIIIIIFFFGNNNIMYRVDNNDNNVSEHTRVCSAIDEY